MSVQNALMSQAHNTNTKTNMTAPCTASVYLWVTLETNMLLYAKKVKLSWFHVLVMMLVPTISGAKDIQAQLGMWLRGKGEVKS